MNYDYSKVKNWLSSKDYYLPGISDITQLAGGEILIIGAAVFELYELQGWIKKLQRKTGDIDLSVGLISNDSAYKEVKKILTIKNYKQDKIHPYRFHPEKIIPGGYAYLDLLAHPQDSHTAKVIAQNAMGVGSNFSLDNFAYVQTNAFDLKNGTIFPNPFGFISLKMASYIDEPLKRIKDFADIIELINGLVENGTHFEIDQLWTQIKNRSESIDLKNAIEKMKNPNEVGNWDLDIITDELRKRNFSNDFIESTLRPRLSDFYDQLV